MSTLSHTRSEVGVAADASNFVPTTHANETSLQPRLELDVGATASYSAVVSQSETSKQTVSAVLVPSADL